jgi:hypothetical protein
MHQPAATFHPTMATTIRRFHPDKSLPKNGEVFVFGSNLAGRHGKGSALVAKERFGAKYGVGRGRQGQSYAIPTKDGRPGTPALADPRATLPLTCIRDDIDTFIEYARSHPHERFFVVRVGCSLAAHSDADIAPLFVTAPANCSFPENWKPWLFEGNFNADTTQPLDVPLKPQQGSLF